MRRHAAKSNRLSGALFAQFDCCDCGTDIYLRKEIAEASNRSQSTLLLHPEKCKQTCNVAGDQSDGLKDAVDCIVMKVAEIVELVLVLVGAAAIWRFADAFPTQIGIGKLLLYGSALLLFQSLLRDLWLLAKARRRAGVDPARVAQCMCVESIAGITGVLIGLMLLTSGWGGTVRMERWNLSIFVVVVLVTGFLIKDYVVESKPWRLRREKDHINIIVKWRKGITPPGGPDQEIRQGGLK